MGGTSLKNGWNPRCYINYNLQKERQRKGMGDSYMRLEEPNA
jgi:hypothetical protein